MCFQVWFLSSKRAMVADSPTGPNLKNQSLPPTWPFQNLMIIFLQMLQYFNEVMNIFFYIHTINTLWGTSPGSTGAGLKYLSLHNLKYRSKPHETHLSSVKKKGNLTMWDRSKEVTAHERLSTLQGLRNGIEDLKRLRDLNISRTKHQQRPDNVKNNKRLKTPSIP